MEPLNMRKLQVNEIILVFRDKNVSTLGQLMETVKDISIPISSKVYTDTLTANAELLEDLKELSRQQ